MKYFFIAFIFCACNVVTKRNDSVNISTEVLDTIQSSTGKVVATPAIFETAFTRGTTQQIQDATVNVYGVTIGKIKITSGYIVACDPGHIDEYGIPFTQVFPKGEFPVQFAIAKLDNDETIAFARIDFSEEPVERWEFALQEGQSPIPVGGKEMVGYSVDLGVGIFVDKDASKALDKSNLTSLDAALYKEMDKHYHNDWRYTMYQFGQHNLAAFSSGFGDGYYASYIGFDSKGNPCRLLTDFGFFHWKNK